MSNPRSRHPSGAQVALLDGSVHFLADDMNRTVMWALGSIGVAVVISKTHLNEDVFEGWIYLVAAFFVITMVVFMMKTGRKLKGEIEGLNERLHFLHR